MTSIIELVRSHFEQVKAVTAKDVTLSEEVRNLCAQNKCGQYGRNWTCPPAVKSVDEFREEIASFDTVLILYRVYDVESSFDWQGMMTAGKDFKGRLLALKKEIAAAGDVDFVLLGAGGCHVCERCTYPDNEPCRRPEEAVIPVEACGIDVMALMKDNGLKYYHGQNTVTYIGAVLYSA